MQDRSGPSGPSRDNAATTLTPTCANPPTPPSSATAGSAAPSNGTISQRQTAFMRERYPEAEIVQDTGGGLNWKRKGLVSLLERLHRGDKLRIVVAHRDRLARFGFELIQWLAEQNGGGIVVLDNTGLQPRTGAHRGYSRHPPHLLLPATRPAPLPQRNPGGSGSIPRRNSAGYSGCGLMPPGGATTRLLPG